MQKAKLFKNILFFVALAALFFVVSDIGVNNIFLNLCLTGWWFVPIVGIWLIVYFINAKAFQLIICDSRNSHFVSYTKSLQLTITGFALNYATPAGMMGGMPYRVVELKPIVGGNKATSSVILYTMLHIMAHIFFWLSSLLVMGLFFVVSQNLMILFVLIFFLFVGLIVLFFRGYKKGLLVKLFEFFTQLPFLKQRTAQFFDQKKAGLMDIDTEISDFYLHRKKVFYRVLAFEYVGRLLNCLEIFFILHAIGVDVSYFHAFVMVAMTTLIANVLFFFPLQVGPREFGYVGAINMLNIVPLVGSISGLGLYVSLITRIREVVWIGFGLLLMKFKIEK